MMAFGWRPMMSCYAGVPKGQQDQPSTPATVGSAQSPTMPPAAPCPSANWFYWGLGLAAFLGIAGGRK